MRKAILLLEQHPDMQAMQNEVEESTKKLHAELDEIKARYREHGRFIFKRIHDYLEKNGLVPKEFQKQNPAHGFVFDGSGAMYFEDHSAIDQMAQRLFGGPE